MNTIIFKSYKTKFLALVFFCIPVILLLTGCELPTDPEKNCDQPLVYNETVGPSQIFLYYDNSSDESDNTIQKYWHTITIKDICPDEFLLVTCKMTTKSEATYDDIANVKLYWIYEPWLTRYKDYIYVIANAENRTQWAGAHLLVPYALGFALEYPATISFQVEITLYDPLPQDEGVSWIQDNISKIEMEVEGTRF